MQDRSNTYYALKKCLPSARIIHDQYLQREISRVWDDNLEVYEADRVWTQLNRE